jgi:hypothetical protein
MKFFQPQHAGKPWSVFPHGNKVLATGFNQNFYGHAPALNIAPVDPVDSGQLA